jgi:hypothetical protein
MSGLAVLAVMGGVVAFIAAGMHQVPEGHIAMYWRGGALLDTVAEPGWRWAPPMVTTRDFVQLTMQTDTVRVLSLVGYFRPPDSPCVCQVREVPCGTSTGVMIYFDRIDVVNQLDRTKAHSTVKVLRQTSLRVPIPDRSV